MFKGCEKFGLIDCCAVISVLPTVSFSAFPCQARVSWLGDAVDGVCTSSACHTLDLLHSRRKYCACDAIDHNLNISESCALEAPSFDGELLATGIKSCSGTDGVNLGVRLDVPAVITSKVTVLRRLTEVGVTDAESDLRDRVADVLVTRVGWEMGDLVP